MATLQKRTNGGWELQFRDEHHRKQTITLSGRKYKERIALQLKDTVEVLVDKRVNNDPRQDPTVKTWVENAPPEIQRKLTRLGLYHLPLKRTVKELWNAFLQACPNMHEPTLNTYIHAQARFFMFFKPDELIGELTQDRMREWKSFLQDCGKYADATITGTITKAKTVFNWAKEHKWLINSPLDGVGRGSYRNEDRDRFITQAEYRKLLDACPSQEWRVIITLARIGGLHPNEIKSLRWSDIGGAKNDRFRALNSKMRQNRKMYEREVPLFPEIVAELDKLRQGNEDKEFVVNRSHKNLAACFNRIAKKAGIGTIPRPFDNMRASRATEVCNEYGAKKESVWLGHSTKTAMQYYLMVTDEDYAVAAGKRR